MESSSKPKLGHRRLRTESYSSVGGGVPYIYNPTTSIQFNGVDEYIDTNNTVANFSASDSFSISFWAKPTALASGGTIKGKRVVSGAGWLLSIANTTSGRFQFTLSDSTPGVLTSRTGNGTFVLDTWSFHTVTYDGSSTNTGIVFYRNGSATPQSKNNETNTLVNTTQSAAVLRMGANSDGSAPFSGYQFNFTIFNRVITGAEHVLLYNGGDGIDPRTVGAVSGNILDWWRLSTGDTAPAANGIKALNGNDGTGVNMDGTNFVADVPT